jgi:hypothetical protein
LAGMLAATAVNPSWSFSREIVNRITTPRWGRVQKVAAYCFYSLGELNSVAVVVTVELLKISLSWTGDVS